MLQPGDSFGDYRVLKLLGKGGMGAVFLLENAEGVQVAAKILDPAEAGEHEARKRFLREAQLALGVKHPNLVETYDIGEDPETGFCYILMEYVSGGSLADRIKAGPLPINDAIRVVYQVASVLELAREKGIVHRDIKPGNIMFGADGKAKLADLGIARGGIGGTDTTTVTQTGMMIGTPAYMAPEQMLDAHHVDTRADIYSLGVVFFEMLTGERPNKDDTIVQLMAKAVAGEPIPDVRTMRPEVSASIAELVSLMCAMKADERISTPVEVTTAISQIVHGHEVTIVRKRPSAVAKKRVPAHKSVSLWILIACAFVAIAGVSAFVLVGMRELRLLSSPEKPTVADVVRPIEVAIPVPRLPPKVVEKTIVITNVVKKTIEKPIGNPVEKPIEKPVESTVVETPALNPPVAQEPRGETDQAVRFAEVDGLTWFYTLEDGNAVIGREKHWFNTRAKPAMYPEQEGKVVVPAELDGHKVTAIGIHAFFRCRKMTSVVIPEGVREIRRDAFHFCDALADVTLPQSLESIRISAFHVCPSLKSVDIGKCPDAPGWAFAICPALEIVNVSLDNPSYVLEDGLLLDRTRTKLVFHPRNRDAARIPEGIRAIGEGAFMGCPFNTVLIPDSVEQIEEMVFSYCANLQEVRFGKGLQAVGKQAFCFCRSLKSLVFPGSLKRLGGSFVYGCQSLGMIEFHGDAPEFDTASKYFLGKVPESLIIAVAPGTRGWNGPGSTDLPKMWPLGNFEDSRPIRYVDAAARLPEREVLPDRETLMVQPVKPCKIKTRPDLRSPACRLVLSCGVVINAEKGCGAAAASLKLKLESALKCAAPIYGSPQRKAPFVVNVSRNDPKVSSTADFTPGFESWSIRLAPDNDYFNDRLGSLAATILTICKEPDWMAFAFYGGGLIEEPMHGNVFRPDFRVPAYMQAGKESAGRQMGLWRVFEELRGWDSAFFTKYCRQKNRRFKEGALGPEIDYDTVVDLLTTVSGRNVVELFRNAGLGSRLRNKGPVGANATKAAPPNANDGKSFDMQKMHGSTFQKTLQKTLDQVFPPWRLGSDYQGQVKLMSGWDRRETLGYVSKVLDRNHVVVLPLHFDVLTPVLSCRRKMEEGEKLLCSVAFGQEIENCELVVQINGRECYRTTLNDAVQWEDFEVDLSDWNGKSAKIDVVARCIRGGSQDGIFRNSSMQKALLYVQRLEWRKQ